MQFVADDPITLSAADYAVFGILIAISVSGGFWYGALGTRARLVKDIKDYLLGGKAMATIPVSLSLIASYVSGVTVLGTPAEVFNFGAQYWLIVVAILLCGVTVSLVYLPVFFSLQLSSSYEYLELRFNRHVRAAASLLFLFDEIFFLPMVVYVPALAFNQLTGINVYVICGLMVLVCGLYTVLGGLRAVVWTDALQTVTMYGGIIVVAVSGTLVAGGFKNTLKVASEANRLHLSEWSLDPTVRQTGWGAIIGGYIYWTCFNSVNQTMVQRYIALPSLKKARIGVFLFSIGAMLAVTMCIWTGLTAFVTWYELGCSPGIHPPTDDRLLPAFVQHISKVKHLDGLSGVFLAGVFGAALSSLSCILNACALVVMEDLIKGWAKMELKPKTEGIIARLVSTLFAVVAVVFVLFIEKLGGVLGVATALSAIASSTTCGVFTLGMCFSHVGSRGALLGALCGAISAGTVSLGSQIVTMLYGSSQHYVKLPDACAANASVVWPPPNTTDGVFPIFLLSYHWIAPIGFVVTLVVGALASLVLDKGHQADMAFLSPVVKRFYTVRRPAEDRLLGEKKIKLHSESEMVGLLHEYSDSDDEYSKYVSAKLERSISKDGSDMSESEINVFHHPVENCSQIQPSTSRKNNLSFD